MEGEMVLVGSTSAKPDVWRFSVDDDRSSNPVVAELHRAEDSERTVTLHYRQDLEGGWRCSPLNHFVTAIER